jgi:hypothetical protein
MSNTLASRKRKPEPGGLAGQSIVEMAILVPFLLILALALSEMAQVFSIYIALVNTARSGANFAALHPSLAVAHASDPSYSNYLDRLYSDMWSAHLDTNHDKFSGWSPSAYPVASSFRLNDPITVTLSYTLTTFSSSMSVPYLGRMGLPDHYNITYSYVMPIRYVP